MDDLEEEGCGLAAFATRDACVGCGRDLARFDEDRSGPLPPQNLEQVADLLRPREGIGQAEAGVHLVAISTAVPSREVVQVPSMTRDANGAAACPVENGGTHVHYRVQR
jgi:hypothetical protein